GRARGAGDGRAVGTVRKAAVRGAADPLVRVFDRRSGPGARRDGEGRPFDGDPETTGSAVLTGTSGPVTTAVGGDGASPEPSPFVAVTRTRSVNPMSASSTT